MIADTTVRYVHGIFTKIPLRAYYNARQRQVHCEGVSETTWVLLPDEFSPLNIDKSSAGRTTNHQPASTWHCTGRLARLFTANTNAERADDSLLTTSVDKLIIT